METQDPEGAGRAERRQVVARGADVEEHVVGEEAEEVRRRDRLPAGGEEAGGHVQGEALQGAG